MKSSTLRKTTIEVVSSWFRKEQFALRVEAVIIRDFRGKQIAEKNFPKAQCGRSLVRMYVDYKLAFCLALLIDKLSQPSLQAVWNLCHSYSLI